MLALLLAIAPAPGVPTDTFVLATEPPAVKNGAVIVKTEEFKGRLVPLPNGLFVPLPSVWKCDVWVEPPVGGPAVWWKSVRVVAAQ